MPLPPQRSSRVTAALNNPLEIARDDALGREPYERAAGTVERNGFKLVSLPGLWGRMRLRRTVVRKGILRLPLLSAVQAAGKNLCAVFATRFWLRGASTRATCNCARW